MKYPLLSRPRLTPVVIVLAFGVSCSAAVTNVGVHGELDGFALPSSADTGTHTFFLDERAEAVWFEMRQVFPASGIPLADEEVAATGARLVSRTIQVDPRDVHCGARPGGEQPLAVNVQGVLTTDLEEVGATRTRIVFRLDAHAESLEPGHTRSRTACVSRGTLERRLVQRTERRLRSVAG